MIVSTLIMAEPIFKCTEVLDTSRIHVDEPSRKSCNPHPRGHAREPMLAIDRRGHDLASGGDYLRQPVGVAHRKTSPRIERTSPRTRQTNLPRGAPRTFRRAPISSTERLPRPPRSSESHPVPPALRKLHCRETAPFRSPRQSRSSKAAEVLDCDAGPIRDRESPRASKHQVKPRPHLFFPPCRGMVSESESAVTTSPERRDS